MKSKYWYFFRLPLSFCFKLVPYMAFDHISDGQNIGSKKRFYIFYQIFFSVMNNLYSTMLKYYPCLPYINCSPDKFKIILNFTGFMLESGARSYFDIWRTWIYSWVWIRLQWKLPAFIHKAIPTFVTIFNAESDKNPPGACFAECRHIVSNHMT